MKKSIKRIMALGIISATLLTALPIGASAEWKQNSDSSWSYYNNNNLLKNTWFYDKQLGKSYYLDSNGVMVHDTVINGYKLGSDGAWIQDNTNSSAKVENIVYEQEPNGWITDATPLTKNNESYLVGTIENNTDLDYYKFTIDSDKKITIMGSLDIDSWGLTRDMNIGILNANGTVIGATSPITMDGKTSQLLSRYTLPAGTYYIAIVGSQEYKYLWDNNKYGILVQFE